MNISWNGFGSFTITGKPVDAEATLVTDPYDNGTGLRFPRTLQASVVCQSHKSEYANQIGAILPEGDKPPFIVTHAGEYEVRGIFVKGISAPTKRDSQHTMYRITLEEIKIGFLGALDRKLTDVELEALGPIDVLLIPFGGEDVLDAKGASEVVNQVEPRLIIPSYLHVSGAKHVFGTVTDACKEIGCAYEESAKAKLTRGSLPEEDMRMLILSRA